MAVEPGLITDTVTPFVAASSPKGKVSETVNTVFVVPAWSPPSTMFAAVVILRLLLVSGMGACTLNETMTGAVVGLPATSLPLSSTL